MINVLTGNKKLLSSFPRDRVGSVSRTPIKSCPGAPKGGCVFSGKACYCLRIGAMYPSVRKHWRAMDSLGFRLWAAVGESIDSQRVTVFRPFSSGGDFLNQRDYNSFCSMVAKRPDVKFYAYTKSLHLDLWSRKPINLVLLQSEGGRYDHLIDYSKLVARVGVGFADGSEDDSVAAAGVSVSLKAH